MTTRIEVNNYPKTEYEVTLDNVTYTITISYMPFNETTSWFFSLSIDDEVITSGRRIKSGVPLVPATLIKGNFYAFPLSSPVDLGDEPWGQTHFLGYVHDQ